MDIMQQSKLPLSYWILSVFILLLCYSCATGPCSSKTYFLDSMETFVDHVGEIKDEISDEEWELKDKEYAVFTDECYPKFRSELDGEESSQYRKLTIKYKSYQATDDVSDLIRKGAKALGTLFGKELEGVDEDVSDFLDNFEEGGGLNDAIKKIKSELEEGGGIREAIEELKEEYENNGDFERILEDLKIEMNEGELKEILEDLKVDLQEAGEDIKEALEESQNNK